MYKIISVEKAISVNSGEVREIVLNSEFTWNLETGELMTHPLCIFPSGYTVDKSFYVGFQQKFRESLAVALLRPSSDKPLPRLQCPYTNISIERDVTNHTLRMIVKVAGLMKEGAVRALPLPFYCPINGSLLDDPVLLFPSGVSVSRKGYSGMLDSGEYACPITKKDILDTADDISL
ncbi:MAG: hypothetical protein ACI9BD_000925 [Candidatus Marinamargulisbacteria bacterium]|jgi:hypothetical protein